MSASESSGIELSYEDLAELFENLGSSLSPTYLHGSLSGILAAGKRMTPDDWLDWAEEMMAPKESLDEAHTTILLGLYQKTAVEFQDENMAFKLMLPREGAPMVTRLEALSDWAGSFLGAFGATGVVKETSDLPATVQEILEDLADIAQVDATSAEELTSAEEDYIAVADHVRVSAITVFLEFNEPPKPASPDTVH